MHEIRDPVHVFIRLHNSERDILNSPPFQRLRHIQQLALTNLVYPGATHKRFEHSLGVMELASRVFDIVTHQDNVSDAIKESMPEIIDDELKPYWRRALRMAALCHDLGHIPFSHAAEELLPQGCNHEGLTLKFIEEGMSEIWDSLKPAMNKNDIVKLAVNPAKVEKKMDKLTTWEYVLSDIIQGDALGVDRMDYLLRDSLHTGVAYGKFDHFRLIDTMRILPCKLEPGNKGDAALDFQLGVEQGGLQSAESMILARYFMYSQVYMHRVRRIYDIHLKDFLEEWLEKGKFSTELQDHLRMTDDEVMVALREADLDVNSKGHIHAKRIINREHFRCLYEQNPTDIAENPLSCSYIYEALKKEFPCASFRYDGYTQQSSSLDFPVRMNDGSIRSSGSVSEVLNRVPVINIGFIFADSTIFKKAGNWLSDNREKIVRLIQEEQKDEEQDEK